MRMWGLTCDQSAEQWRDLELRRTKIERSIATAQC